MKTLTLTFALLITAFIAQAQTQTVTVTIDNVMSDKGHIMVALHSADTFMKGKGILNIDAKAKKGEVTVTFKDVEPGAYAVLVLHDANDNKRMDYEPNGMPKEHYGTSNNALAMGPPQFTDAKFEVANKDLDLNIRF